MGSRATHCHGLLRKNLKHERTVRSRASAQEGRSRPDQICKRTCCATREVGASRSADGASAWSEPTANGAIKAAEVAETVAICLPSLPGNGRASDEGAGVTGSAGAQQEALQQVAAGALLRQQGATGWATAAATGQWPRKQGELTAWGPANKPRARRQTSAGRRKRGLMQEFYAAGRVGQVEFLGAPTAGKVG